MGKSKLLDIVNFEGNGREKYRWTQVMAQGSMTSVFVFLSFFLLVGDEFFATLPIFSKGEKLVN
jgi:hypothetical protein